MKPDIKQRWIAALRSGKYKQGRNRLKQDDCYCALGVLCDLFAQEHKLNWRPVLQNAPKDYSGQYILENGLEEMVAYPSHSVCQWAGVEFKKEDSDPGLAPIPKPFARVAAMNDRDFDKLSFPQISDYIEANL